MFLDPVVPATWKRAQHHHPVTREAHFCASPNITFTRCSFSTINLKFNLLLPIALYPLLVYFTFMKHTACAHHFLSTAGFDNWYFTKTMAPNAICNRLHTSLTSPAIWRCQDMLFTQLRCGTPALYHISLMLFLKCLESRKDSISNNSTPSDAMPAIGTTCVWCVTQLPNSTSRLLLLIYVFFIGYSRKSGNPRILTEPHQRTIISV